MRRLGYIAIACLLSVVDATAQRNDIETLTTFPLGAVVITNAHVRIAPVPAKSRGSSKQPVEGLELDRGKVTIGAGSGQKDEKIYADIAPGVPGDPGARLSGTVEWKNGAPVRFRITSFHLRLTNISGSSQLYGGVLHFAPGASVFIDNTSPLVINEGKSDPGSSVTIRAFGSLLDDPQVALQGTPISAAFSSRAGKSNTFAFDLGSGQLRSVDAEYLAELGQGSSPINELSFSGGDRITGGSLSLQGLRLSIEGGSPHVEIREAHIDHPTIHVQNHDGVPVAAAAEYLARSITSDASADKLNFSALSAAETFATADPWEVANQLNEIGVFQPDAFLPTGNSDLRYIRPVDLGKIYESVARSSPDKTITTVIVRQTDGVVSEVVIDTAPAPSLKDSVGHEQHPVCFLVETLVGFVATKAVDALFAEVPVSAATAAWLRVTNPLNPRFAVPTFVTTYAVSKGAVKLFGEGFKYKGVGLDGISGILTGTIASNYCEVFIAQLPNRYVFRKPNYLLKPRLFETIQVDPDKLFTDELGLHYRTYLTNTVDIQKVIHDPAFRDLRTASKNNSELRKAVSAVSEPAIQQAAELRGEHIKVAETRDEESTRQRKTTEGISQASSQQTANNSDAQRREDRRRKEAEQNVTKQDPNAQVPGTPPSQPGTPQDNSKKKGSSQSSCPGINCIETTAPKPEK